MAKAICHGPGTGDTQLRARTAGYSHMGLRCSREGESPVPPRMDLARRCPCAAPGAISPGCGAPPWGWRVPHLPHSGPGALLLQRPKYETRARSFPSRGHGDYRLRQSRHQHPVSHTPGAYLCESIRLEQSTLLFLLAFLCKDRDERSARGPLTAASAGPWRGAAAPPAGPGPPGGSASPALELLLLGTSAHPPGNPSGLVSSCHGCSRLFQPPIF